MCAMRPQKVVYFLVALPRHSRGRVDAHVVRGHVLLDHPWDGAVRRHRGGDRRAGEGARNALPRGRDGIEHELRLLFHERAVKVEHGHEAVGALLELIHLTEHFVREGDLAALVDGLERGVPCGWRFRLLFVGGFGGGANDGFERVRAEFPGRGGAAARGAQELVVQLADAADDEREALGGAIGELRGSRLRLFEGGELVQHPVLRHKVLARGAGVLDSFEPAQLDVILAVERLERLFLGVALLDDVLPVLHLLGEEADELLERLGACH
mmetsp:Transcript_16706/g.54603  ORF Transcript_16706/g.54603 Transcript_16706/m.54603 type:complete len:269 (-) Transcript_16706:970-1776(-)